MTTIEKLEHVIRKHSADVELFADTKADAIYCEISHRGICLAYQRAPTLEEAIVAALGEMGEL